MKTFRIALFSDEYVPSESFLNGAYETKITTNDTLNIESDFAGSLTNNYNLDDSLIVSKLMAMIVTQRYHASIVGINLLAASNTARSLIYNSFDKYGVQIRTLNDNIDRLILVKSSIKQSTNIDKTNTITDDEATDTVDNAATIATEETQAPNSILNKKNDTPNAGNNPNLLNDTYLSESTRVTETLGDKNVSIDDQRLITNVIGERRKVNQDIALSDDNYTLTVEDNDVQSIKELLVVIDTLYQNWISHLDKVLFTYNFQ